MQLEAIPAGRRSAIREFIETTRSIFTDNLLSLSVYGGWLRDEPLYENAPASTVVTLKQTDLASLDRLSREGERLGGAGVRAPLIMTPRYIADSCDTFPLELLEIQRLHICLLGADQFDKLTFAPNDVRHQAERESKSSLIQLRQGLLASAGQFAMLRDVTLTTVDRTIRVLRGLAYLHEPDQAPGPLADVLRTAKSAIDVPLPTLEALAQSAHLADRREFDALYHELESLSAFVDALQVAS